MAQVLTVLHLAFAIFAISDIMTKLRDPVPKFLWVVCVIAIPLGGSFFWYYVQYMAPKVKQRIREERRERIRARKGKEGE